MELKALIECITRHVLSEAMVDNAVTVKAGYFNQAPDKQVLVIIPEYAVNTNGYLNFLSERYKDYKQVLANLSAIKIINRQNINYIDAKSDEGRQYISNAFNNFEIISCICPGIMLMSSIESMDDRGFVENLILSSIIHKKKTEFLIDYSIDELGKNKLAQKLQELIRSMNSLGIDVKTINSPEGISITQKTVKAARDLITEKDIEMFKNKENEAIYCEKGCIITPLALDRAKELGIQVVFKDR